MCGKIVEPSQIEYPYFDEWVYTDSGRGLSTKWGLCNYFWSRDMPYILKCKKCINDWVDSITIDRAEKGTLIYLSNDSYFYGPGAYVSIKILKNFNKDWPSVEEEYRQGITIKGLTKTITGHKYYKMTYNNNGDFWGLNDRVSNVRVYFDHRDPTKR